MFYRYYLSADDNVNDTIINLFRAAQHISDNFIKSSEVATKRTILKSIFRTLQLKDTTLCYDLNFPFNVLYKNTENNKWRCKKPFTFGLCKTCVRHTTKTVKNREKQGIFAKAVFLDNFCTTQIRTHPQICGVFTLSAPKFPTKITGNFLDYIRELSANIRDYF